MKYIRTKDGRISYLDTEPYEDEVYYVVITNKGRMKCYRPDEVIKQANSIEELCDEFVIFNPNLNPKYQKQHFTVKVAWEKFLNADSAKYQKEFDIDLYGAVWTDKGLIYVAKMNNDGVLCLI